MEHLVRKTLRAAAAATWVALGMLGSTPAQAADGFVGAYEPANWAISNAGSITGSSATPGSATFSSSQLALVGGNAGDPGCAGGTYGFLSSPCQVQALIGLAGSYTFDYSYVTFDGDGSGGDIFGVIVDGVPIAISDPGGATTQLGNRTYVANGSFGFFLNCTDCLGGAATTTVTSFAVAAVPEPQTYALMLLGSVVCLAWMRRRG